MKSTTKLIFTNDRNEKFFGEGPCMLLRTLEHTGSLHAAAQSMGMAYTKALKLLKNAEQALGFALTTRSIGGKNGGGSSLTPEGLAWIERYEACRDACIQENQRLFREFFPQAGCIIMASGLGKRFRSNKLTADFGGKPMIRRVLDATEGIFPRRIVVTRHEEIAVICREQGIEVLLHDLPHRSDTIRLGMEAMCDMDGCMFCPGDQPLLRRGTVASLLLRWQGEPEAIWRTSFEGAQGSPVIFPKWAFDQMMQLPEGKGGSSVIALYPDRVRTMEVADKYELMDADTPEDLAMLQKAGGLS